MKISSSYHTSSATAPNVLKSPCIFVHHKLVPNSSAKTIVGNECPCIS